MNALRKLFGDFALSLDGDTLDSLVVARRSPRRTAEEDVEVLLKALRTRRLRTLEGEEKDESIASQRDVHHSTFVGNKGVTEEVRNMVDNVAASALSTRTKQSRSSQKTRKALKENASELRSLAHELAVGERSVWFVRSI